METGWKSWSKQVQDLINSAGGISEINKHELNLKNYGNKVK